MEKEITITDKEHTWLVLKYGPDPYYRLAFLSMNKLLKLSETEQRAAKIGERIIAKEKEDLFRELSELTQKEIDNELIKTLVQQANDESN